jgi:hypothetical protein
MKKKFRKFDLTAENPNLLFKGKKKVKTVFGSTLSISAIVVCLIYFVFSVDSMIST